MRAGLVVVGRIRGQDLPQMLHAEDKNVIRTVAPERSNQSFSICLHDLLAQPLCRRMPGHRTTAGAVPWPRTTKANSSSKVTVGTTQRSIASNRIRMVVQECPPVLGWRCSASDHVRRDHRLGNFEPELQQLAMDSRGAPQWVLFAHTPDEIT